MITAARMMALCPSADRVLVSAIAPSLESNREHYGVSTAFRCAHLMAQLAHESAGFSRLAENLNYTAQRIPAVFGQRLKDRAAELERNPEKLANAAYAKIIGNGPEASGDGWRFRGRGLIQLTGRDNYRAASAGIGVDLVADPDLAARPDMAARLALSFWARHGCNEAADTDSVAAVTRIINGRAMHGIEQRAALTMKARGLFVPPQPPALAMATDLEAA